jgi:hypothetical protein
MVDSNRLAQEIVFRYCIIQAVLIFGRKSLIPDKKEEKTCSGPITDYPLDR